MYKLLDRATNQIITISARLGWPCIKRYRALGVLGAGNIECAMYDAMNVLFLGFP